MTKMALRSFLGLVLVIASACSSSSTKGGSPTTLPGGTSQAAVTASDALKFTPDTLSVSVGQTVTWTNSGAIGHTVTFDGGPAFDQALSAGAKVTRAFTTAGTFAYHCTIHGQAMHGTVLVT